MAEPYQGIIAITGGTGFVGTYATAYLAAKGYAPRLITRRAGVADPAASVTIVTAGDLAAPGTELAPALAGADAVVHLAARAHRAVGEGADALALYRAENRDPTIALARAAATAGVRHFIFASTAYVHGHGGDGLIHPDMPLAPSGAYAVSKAEAETALAGVARDTGLAVTIIRPTIVYGPDAKANIRALSRAVARSLPLPFAAVSNRRSFLGIENLASFIDHRLAHPPAAGRCEAFLLADAEIVSTPQFIRLLAAAHGRRARLLPVPARALAAALSLVGRAGMAQSLLGSFAADIGPARALGWAPPVSLAQGLVDMVGADGDGRLGHGA
ncbi:NAD-dependent epimerase/dehydratase family protein [Chelatococcus reniformis]|uniref:UDP-glucose 4-epimerase n=1 Tax=Chelatococcus reniformis TaxID=1494448 RepID=A0A916UXS3_9HYPH|nr:NAD-dependent epimerase/dehydratase family protein [Chelatococcus reniformis]GGC93571.1 UDP-glucose 4-epimerase [Chelatococcus reniformis]